MGRPYAEGGEVQGYYPGGVTGVDTEGPAHEVQARRGRGVYTPDEFMALEGTRGGGERLKPEGETEGGEAANLPRFQRELTERLLERFEHNPDNPDAQRELFERLQHMREHRADGGRSFEELRRSTPTIFEPRQGYLPGGVAHPEGKEPDDWTSRLPLAIDPGYRDSSWRPPVEALPDASRTPVLKGEDVKKYREDEHFIHQHTPTTEGAWDDEWPPLVGPYSYGQGLRDR